MQCYTFFVCWSTFSFYWNILVVPFAGFRLRLSALHRIISTSYLAKEMWSTPQSAASFELIATRTCLWLHQQTCRTRRPSWAPTWRHSQSAVAWYLVVKFLRAPLAFICELYFNSWRWQTAQHYPKNHTSIAVHHELLKEDQQTQIDWCLWPESFVKHDEEKLKYITIQTTKLRSSMFFFSAVASVRYLESLLVRITHINTLRISA